jgi:hypothetical protein
VIGCALSALATRLSVAAEQGGVAWIDAMRARCTIDALDVHKLRANAARAIHHESQRSRAGQQHPR